jgi:acyl-CoA synthetase (AMP-forming)/AMP-acid ligase II
MTGTAMSACPSFFPEALSAPLRPWLCRIFGVPARRHSVTSGSTGTPLPHRKTWGRLVRCVRDGAQRLGLPDGRAHALIGTVPAQHMYGFELTVLLALAAGHSISAERPFYPADIAAAIAAAPRPRVLVSTPIHLRALVASEIDIPPVDLIVSATAPLTRELAREVEAKFHTTLLKSTVPRKAGRLLCGARLRRLYGASGRMFG